MCALFFPFCELIKSENDVYVDIQKIMMKKTQIPMRITFLWYLNPFDDFLSLQTNGKMIPIKHVLMAPHKPNVGWKSLEANAKRNDTKSMIPIKINLVFLLNLDMSGWSSNLLLIIPAIEYIKNGNDIETSKKIIILTKTIIVSMC